MKYLLLTSLCLMSLSTFSSDQVNDTIVEECRTIAVQKLGMKAKQFDHQAEIDEESIEVLDAENKLTSPSVYIWFKAFAETADGSRIPISAMTEKRTLPVKKPCI